MVKLAVSFKKAESEDDIQIYLHPESLAELVTDLQEDGLSESEIAIEVAKIKNTILEDFKARMATGDLDADGTEDGSGCGDPSCPNCSVGIVYH